MARHSPLFGKGEADLGVEIFGRRKKWLFFAKPRPAGGRAAGLGTVNVKSLWHPKRFVLHVAWESG